jgi:hypothetical protein
MAVFGLSQYVHQALLNSFFGKTSALGALASAPTVMIGLSSTKPTPAGANITEPSTGSYARVETAASDWGSATDADPSVIQNSEIITFAQADADWVAGADLTHAVLFDNESPANFLGYGELAAAKPVLNGDTASFGVGDIDVSIAATPDP